MTKAAITPGTQAQSVNKNTINTEPHPLSKTAKGGNKIDKITRQILIKIVLKLLLQMFSKITKRTLQNQSRIY